MMNPYMRKKPSNPRRYGSIWNPITRRRIQNTKANRDSIIRQVLKYRQNRLVLISCSKTKAFKGEESLKAKDAYCSPLFNKSKEWAEGKGLNWAVISARHGVVWPNEEIEDYDLTLGELSKEQKSKWANMVASQLYVWSQDSSVENAEESPQVIALAGKAYTEPLKKGLKSFFAEGGQEITVEEPLEGLQVGERLSKLTKENDLNYSALYKATGVKRNG
jgi:hypothetical protein